MRSRQIIVMLAYIVLFGSILSQLSLSACSIDTMQPSVCSASATAVSQYQNVTHEGDILVSGSETFTIQDLEFHMLGKITVTDTSTLLIRNAKFVTIPTWDGESIVLEGHANLAIMNSTVIFKHPGGFDCRIIAYDNAQGNITLSTIRQNGDLVAYDNSSIHVRNSTMTISPEPHTDYCGVVTYGVSTAKIENSNIDGVFVWDNSSTSIMNSVVGLVRTGRSGPDQTTVNITSCEINAIEAYGDSPVLHIKDSTIAWRLGLGSNASAWLTGCSVGEMTAGANASIFLIDSSADCIKTHDDATVLVGWNLPIFGLVMMHHTLVPIVQTSIIIILIAIVVISLVLLFRKTRRPTRHTNGETR